MCFYDSEWVKKYMDYEADNVKPWGRPMWICKEAIEGVEYELYLKIKKGTCFDLQQIGSLCDEVTDVDLVDCVD